jgi:Tfp pilus assembly protein PilX
MPTFRRPLSRQRGAALFLTLCIVVALMLMGASAVRTALNAERSARGDRDRHIALQAAEAALEDAERDIEGGSNPGSQRAAMFAKGSSTGFVEGCGSGADNLGLCLRMPEPAAPAWQSAALAGSGSGSGGGMAVQYGLFTGASMPHGAGALPARLPRYLIELIPYVRAGHDASAPPGNFYRITAIGFGASETTWVVLQSFYLKGALA